jgi:hypothetical protein
MIMLWKKLRLCLVFGLALSTSPAITPIIVPRCFDSALLAGTPTALWVTHNAGWVYGGLTFISLVSLIFGLHFLGDKTNVNHKSESGE